MATIRFCLSCSAKRPELVERACPALDKTRAEKVERNQVATRRRAEAKRKRVAKQRAAREENQEARFHYGGFDLRKELTKLVAAARKNGYELAKPKMTVSWRHDGYTTGRSWGHQKRIHLTVPKDSPAAPVLAILAHEVAHQATPREHHGDGWRWCFEAIMVDAYGVGAVDLGTNRHSIHQALTQALATKLDEALTYRQLEADQGEDEED